MANKSPYKRRNISPEVAFQALLRHSSSIQNDPNNKQEFTQAISIIRQYVRRSPCLPEREGKEQEERDRKRVRSGTDSKGLDDDASELTEEVYDDVDEVVEECDLRNPVITIDINGLTRTLDKSKKANIKKYASVVAQAQKRVNQLLAEGEISKEQKAELDDVVKKSKRNIDLLRTLATYLNHKEHTGRLICVSFSKADDHLITNELKMRIECAAITLREQRQAIIDYLQDSVPVSFNLPNTLHYLQSFDRVIKTIKECYGQGSEMTARTIIDHHIVGCAVVAKTIHTVLPELWISRGTECAIRVDDKQPDGVTTTVLLTGRIDYAILTTRVEDLQANTKYVIENWRKKMFQNKGLQHLVDIMNEIQDRQRESTNTRSNERNRLVHWDIFFLEAKRNTELVGGEEKKVILVKHLPQMAAQVIAAHITALPKRKYIKFCLSNGNDWLFGVYDCEQKTLHYMNHELDCKQTKPGSPPVTLMLLYMWITLPGEVLREKFDFTVIVKAED